MVSGNVEHANYVRYSVQAKQLWSLIWNVVYQ